MNKDLTTAYINALTGSPDTVCDWRVINDRVKAMDAINIRGSLSQVYDQLATYNLKNWGVFVCVNQMDVL